MEFNRDIRMRGKGTVHFVDEEKRPRALTGEIIVDFNSVFQDLYVKVIVIELEPPSERQYLMPFKSVLFIEWR